MCMLSNKWLAQFSQDTPQLKLVTELNQVHRLNPELNKPNNKVTQIIKSRNMHICFHIF